MTEQQTSESHPGLTLLVACRCMFGFGFLLVPLYDVFCEITGFGGRTNTEAVALTEAPDLIARFASSS